MRKDRSNQTARSVASLAAAAALAVAAVGVTPAAGDAIYLLARDGATQPSSFELDFGPFGGVASANITHTQMELELDATAETARILRYFQLVDPLILPGGVSTGDITVEIVDGSSQGTFNAAAGTFATRELYRIDFTGDLRPFGLTSPVTLPGESQGTVAYTSAGAGTIEMVWAGEGQLQNPQNPKQPIRFTYECRVNAAFVVWTPGDLNCDGEANNLDIDSFVLALIDRERYAAAHPACDARNGDVNHDGAVNNFDIDPFVDLLTRP